MSVQYPVRYPDFLFLPSFAPVGAPDPDPRGALLIVLAALVVLKTLAWLLR